MIDLQAGGVMADADTQALTTMQRFLGFVDAAQSKAGRDAMAASAASMLNASQANRDLLAEVAAERIEIARLTAAQAQSRKELEGLRFENDKAAAKVADDRKAADKRIEEASRRESAVTAREQQFAKDRQQFDDERGRFRAARDAVAA